MATRSKKPPTETPEKKTDRPADIPELDVNIRQLKEFAALSAVDFARSGMVIGLGHGSTALLAIRRIGQLLREGELQEICAVPCSRQAGESAMALGIPLTTLEAHPVIDLTIDGADEIDPKMNIIKGGGGALLHEKIVARASLREIIIADDSKLSPALGTKRPVPVEVIPFGWNPVGIYLESLGAHIELRKDKGGDIFRTEEGNFIIDCRFGPIEDPDELSARLRECPGVVEHGLWGVLATDVIVAGKKGLKHMKRPKGEE